MNQKLAWTLIMTLLSYLNRMAQLVRYLPFIYNLSSAISACPKCLWQKFSFIIP